MPRLIDADALYQSFGASGNCNDCSLDAYKCQYYNEHTLMEFCERIDDAPTVDAVPVVRCEDCESWGLNAIKKDEKGEVIYGDCLHFCYSTPKWFYCAWGERKNGQ
jgi:hypothetical protein